MPASLSIRVFNAVNIELPEISFFETDEWNVDTEKDLLLRVQELLAVSRNVGISFAIKINLEVKDVAAAIFLLNKKKSSHIEINNQRLSIREIEILGLIMQGMTTQEIANKLFISFETVRSHRKNILEKTGAKNTAALINHYHQTFFES